MTNYEKVMSSFFGRQRMEDYIDGLPLRALHALQGDELKEVRDRVLQGVRAKDERSIIAAGELQEREAIPFLEAMFASEGRGLGEELRVEVALALWLIGGFSRAGAALLEVAQGGTVDRARRRAVEALGRLDDRETEQYLIRALEDPDDVVRLNAVRSLVQRRGTEKHGDLSLKWYMRIIDKDAKIRETCRQEVLESLGVSA